MSVLRLNYLLLILAVLFALACDRQQADPIETALPALERIEPEIRNTIEKIAAGVYQVGKITVDGNRREIRFGGQVNMAHGLIEVAISTPYGKTHEALLTSEIRPRDLHLACLLLGLQEGSNPAWYIPPEPEYRSPDMAEPPGSPVDIFVSWETENGGIEQRLESLLIDVRTEEPWPQSPWVFIGSYVDEQGRYMADGIGSIVTNYHDHSAVIDVALEKGRLDDYTFAYPEKMPPAGTPVHLRVAPSSNPILKGPNP